MKAPQGKGIFIWQLWRCAGGDMQRLAEMAADAGLDWVAIKAQDGINSYNPAKGERPLALLEEAKAALGYF